MRKRLDLRRERLAELTTDELTLAVGGVPQPAGQKMTCPVGQCVDALLYTQLPGCGDITANTC